MLHTQKEMKKKKLGYDDIFLEYSWNIPYSKKIRFLLRWILFWIFHFSIFIFDGIFRGIFHIPIIKKESCDACAQSLTRGTFGDFRYNYGVGADYFFKYHILSKKQETFYGGFILGGVLCVLQGKFSLIQTVLMRIYIVYKLGILYKVTENQCKADAWCIQNIPFHV